MFNKIEGHTVLFSAKAINAEQFKLAQEIIKHFEGRTVLSRKECRDAHGVLRGRRAAPYFISKNVACKVKGQHGMYDLSRLKLSAAAAKAPVVAAETDAPAVKSPKKAAKKESKPKREAKAKKGIDAPAAAPETAPAETAPTEMPL